MGTSSTNRDAGDRNGTDASENPWAALTLRELRGYRRRLTEEEERVSYWRRLVHARIDVLEAQAHHERPLRLDELVRVLGDTGTGRTRNALVRLHTADPLPELPVLEEMWVTQVDTQDPSAVRHAVSRLREAEHQLTDYRRALHERIDGATTELIGRYRHNPASALVALRSPHTAAGGPGMSTASTHELEATWRDFSRTREPGLRNRLVLQYAPLVKYVAGRMRARLPETLEHDDLVSDGVLGLMDAIERFEPARGLSFQTFAVPRIRGAIIDGMRAMDFVPRSVRDKLRAVQRAQLVLEERLGRPPEESEVAREAGMGLGQLRDLRKQASTNHASIDDLDLDLADELTVGLEDLEQGDTNVALMRAVDQLSERDKIIIALYYFEGFTMADIGEVLGVTESRVSQVHRRVTVALREKLLQLEVA